MVLDVSFPDSLLGLMKERLVEAEMMLAVMLAVIRMMRMSRRIRINNNIISSTSFSLSQSLIWYMQQLESPQKVSLWVTRQYSNSGVMKRRKGRFHPLLWQQISSQIEKDSAEEDWIQMRMMILGQAGVLHAGARRTPRHGEYLPTFSTCSARSV